MAAQTNQTASMTAPLDSVAKPLPLQFGFEIECYIASLTSKNIQPKSTAVGRTHEHLRKVHGLSCEKTPRTPSVNRYRTWELTHDISLRIKQTDEGMREHYQNACDFFGKSSSISLGGVELISPPMPALSTVGAPQTQQVWAGEIFPYFKALTSQVERAKRTDQFYREPDFFPYTTTACGFHVHVGTRDNEILPLPVLKHLAILSLIYEPVFNALHAHHRSLHKNKKGTDYCASNRAAFRRDGHSYKDYNLTATFFTQRIEQCTSLQDLVYLMSIRTFVSDKRHLPSDPRHPSLRGAKFHITNWVGLHPAVRTPTIEFRQPAGTLDSTHAAHTVQLYIALVRAAERRANADAAGLPSETQEEIGTHHGLFTVLDLCAESVTYWKDQVMPERAEQFARESGECWPPTCKDECAKCREIALETLPREEWREELAKGKEEKKETTVRMQVIEVDAD